MKLLIDIGNTRVKWALADHAVLSQGDASDWSSVVEHKDSIDSAWVSCVGQSSTLDDIAEQIMSMLGMQLNLAEVTGKAGGLVNQYRDLDKLGVDRWVAAAGARALRPTGALLVVDVGTAVTIDLIDADHNYQGGVILPGFAMMHDALVGRTAGIQSHREAVSNVIGKTTHECVNAGAHYGVVGAIERIVSEVQASLGREVVTLLITGGDAELVTHSSRLPFMHHANLLFEGLIVLSECSNNIVLSKT